MDGAIIVVAASDGQMYKLPDSLEKCSELITSNAGLKLENIFYLHVRSEFKDLSFLLTRSTPLRIRKCWSL